MTIEFLPTKYTKYCIDLMSTNKLAKYAANIIEKMGLDINDFPLVLERLQKKTIRWYEYNYINGPKHKDYIPLWKLEDLFQGYDSMMAYIIEDLAFKKEHRFKRDAKALALRNGLLHQIREDVREKLDKIQLSPEELNIDCIEDRFGPISEPVDEYFQLPEETKVTFIGNEEDVKLIEILLDCPIIGIDCEWRPSLVKFNKTGVALLQIGDTKNVFLVDMKALKESEALDSILTRVFTSDKIRIIWMSIQNDLGELAKGTPKLNFFRKIENLFDIQPMYSSLYKQKEGLGLSKIVDALLGYKICKFEQMANWELRPLRLSQQHYSATDSFILVQLFEKMKAYAIENDVDIEDYNNTYIAGVTKLNTYNSGGGSFQIHKEDYGKATLKTIRLKAGESIAPNAELAQRDLEEEKKDYKFCIDFNLTRLNK